jgi:polar amino acid transport system substrate-binding protein
MDEKTSEKTGEKMMSDQADPRTTDIVQTGKIRCALFLPQYTRNPSTGELHGVGTGYIAIEAVRALADRLRIAALFVECPTPTKAIASLKNDACDVAFLGIEPARAAEVDFSRPVFQFDYAFLVPAGSAIQNCADADRPGVRIAVVRGHASDLALRRIIAHAEIVGSELPDTAFDLLGAGRADALAFPREHLLDYAAKLPGARVLDDGYGVNRVAIAVPQHRAAWLAYVDEFVEAAKASGLIARAITRGGLRGFAVAR